MRLLFPALLPAATFVAASLLAATLAFSALAADPPRPSRPAVRPTSTQAANPQGGTQHNVPKAIGKWDDWQAATHQEAGQLVCYAFVKANRSEPNMPGRGDVVLTVTQRTGGRDAVAISAGFAYGPNAEVQVQADDRQLPFYTSGRSAFARDGKAAVAAFEKARQAQARSPGPRNQQVSDTFSLRGFSAAYQAINKACPAR